MEPLSPVRLIVTAIVGALFLLSAAAGAENRPPVWPNQTIAYSFAPLIDKAAPAVVNIYTRKIIPSASVTRVLDGSAFWQLFRDTLLFGYGRDRIENSLGSGVIVTAQGVIVTNHHVVANADGIMVALTDGRVLEARLLQSDPRSDIAVLRIETGSPLPFIEFGDSDSLKVGDPVIAIGNPFGLGQTVTTGIVSALARTTFGAADFRFYIQTDAAINPGNSGGAQIGMDGRLIGINTAIFTTSGGSQGLGFAIPSNMVRTIVESAVMGKPVIHPWIGVSGQAIPPSLAALLGLTGNHGALLTGIYKGGPADQAGLAPGDVVLAVNGIPVLDMQALLYRIATQVPGAALQLTVVRRGKVHGVAVIALAPPTSPPPDEAKLSGLSPFRGARVVTLSPALAEEIGADNAISGVAVLEVGPASAAAHIGLRAGDIIRSLDGGEIATTAQLTAFQPRAFTPWRMIVFRAGQNLAILHPNPAKFSP